MPFGMFQIKYGTFTDLEVLVDPDTREIWVTRMTLMRLLGHEEKDSTGARSFLGAKSLQSFTGNTLAGVEKSKQAKDITGRKNTVKVMPFKFARQIILWDAIEHKNPEAIALLSAGFAESFTSLALEQAGIQVSVAERQDILEYYLRGYHQFFDWIRDHHLKVTGKEAQRHHYIRVNQIIDAVICNRENFDSDRAKNATKDELRDIENFQRYFMKERAPLYPNLKPLDAIKDTLLKQYTNASELLGN